MYYSSTHKFSLFIPSMSQFCRSRQCSTLAAGKERHMCSCHQTMTTSPWAGARCIHPALLVQQSPVSPRSDIPVQERHNFSVEPCRIAGKVDSMSGVGVKIHFNSFRLGENSILQPTIVEAGGAVAITIHQIVYTICDQNGTSEVW